MRLIRIIVLLSLLVFDTSATIQAQDKTESVFFAEDGTASVTIPSEWFAVGNAEGIFITNNDKLLDIYLQGDPLERFRYDNDDISIVIKRWPSNILKDLYGISDEMNLQHIIMKSLLSQLSYEVVTVISTEETEISGQPAVVSVLNLSNLQSYVIVVFEPAPGIISRPQSCE